MPPNPFKPVRPGGQISAGELNRAFGELVRSQLFKVEPPLEMAQDGAGMRLRIAGGGKLARVTGNDGGSPPKHAWEEVYLLAGVVTLTPAGMTGSVDYQPLYSVDGASTMTTGTVVFAERGVGEFWQAKAEESNPGSTTITFVSSIYCNEDGTIQVCSTTVTLPVIVSTVGTECYTLDCAGGDPPPDACGGLSRVPMTYTVAVAAGVADAGLGVPASPCCAFFSGTKTLTLDTGIAPCYWYNLTTVTCAGDAGPDYYIRLAPAGGGAGWSVTFSARTGGSYLFVAEYRSLTLSTTIGVGTTFSLFLTTALCNGWPATIVITATS